jgi:alpha-ketoglutarate-dependent sulfate ester dioxygenase
MTDITVNPAAGRIGAEIGGVDISQPLSADEIDTVQRALDEWKVVFFRGQNLDHASQIAFGRQFGELTYAHPHDDAPPDTYPEIYTVDPRRFTQRYGIDDEPKVRRYSYTSGWHTDVTPAINPPAGSILRADVLPAYGGDTTFTNLVAAYEGLSEPFKQFVDTLRAEHKYGANWSGLPRPGRAGLAERYEQNALVSNHPVVRVHPRTGEKALFVNPVFTDHIVDVSPIESRLILGYLFDEITRAEYQVRFRWEPGSVAFWDNRATSHLGPQDIGHLKVERVLHRVTLIGEVPVGPDGRESDLIEGTRFVSKPVFATAAPS